MNAIRTATIGHVQTEDFTCTDTSCAMIHFPAHVCCLVTFANTYIWSQLEPAIAVLCACLVTYKPLFANINLSFPKLSSYLGRSHHTDSSADDSIAMSDRKYSQLQSPIAQTFHSRGYDAKRIQNLNAKAMDDDLHVINVDLGTSRPSDLPAKTLRKGSISRQTSQRDAETSSQPAYHAPPAVVDEITDSNRLV